MLDQIVYTRSSGGVPPNALRITIAATGEVTAERHDQFPPPATVTSRTGRCTTEQFARVAAVLEPLESAQLRGPVPDSPNEWFELIRGDARSAFSIVSLYGMPDSPEHTAVPEIRAALADIVAALGGEP